MLDGLKPYSEYKDSGQPWLGAVPAHWHIERLARLFRLRSEWPVEGDQRITGYLDGRVTLRSNVAGQKIKGVVKEAGWQRVHPGDFAISGMNAHLGGMGVSDSLGKCSPIYLVLIPKTDTNAAFVSRCVRHIAHSNALKVLVSTIRFNSADFKRDHLKLIWVQVPPPAEQAGIVRFLGAVDRKVNRFIRAKRRLIEVLTEQKQAIITHAVTKGLNPHAPLKPSGIDWLGDVPEHWEVRKLRSLFTRHGSGTTPSGDAYYGGDVPWVMTGDLKDSVLSATQRSVTHRALEEVKALRIYPAGSLLVAMYGATIGKTGVLSMDACTNQACCVLAEPRPESNVRFLQAFVIMARPQLVQQSYGGGQPNINSEIVRSLRIPLPPRAEQDSILDAIAQRTGTIDDAIDRASREIDLIREYRTRLVADVVTGKVDVRAAAASIPDEPCDVAAGDQSGEVLDGEGDDAEARDVDAEDAAPPPEEVEA